MYGTLLFSFKKTLKIRYSNYLSLILSKKNIICKNFYFFYFKKKVLFFLKSNYKITFLKLFLKTIFNFLQGFIVSFTITGRRFKFFINSNFFFFKMDTSNFLNINLLYDIFIKKNKKIINFFFLDLRVFKIIEQIKNLRIPDKYTKKGILFF